jgi:hypothetical protein
MRTSSNAPRLAIFLGPVFHSGFFYVLFAVAALALLSSCFGFPWEATIRFEGRPAPPLVVPHERIVGGLRGGRFYFTASRVIPSSFDIAFDDGRPNPAAALPAPQLHWSVHATLVSFKPRYEWRSIDWRPIRWGSRGFGNGMEERTTVSLSVSAWVIALMLVIIACIRGGLLKRHRPRAGFVVTQAEPK